MPNREDLSDYNQALNAGMPPIGDESVGGGAMVSDRDTAHAPVQVVVNYGDAGESDDDGDTNDDDYASTHNFGDIDSLVDAMEAIEQLRKQINVMKRENKVVNARCQSITAAYLGAPGGKRQSVRVNELKGLDQQNVLNIRKIVNNVLTKNELILREGWHVYHVDANTFCQRFIKMADIKLPKDKFVNWYQYWTTFATIYINSMMGTRRNNLTQKLRGKFESECVCCI